MRATMIKSLLRAGAAICLAMTAEASAEPPLAGCYERIYDEAHLRAHRRQMVRHVRLKIAPTSVSPSEGGDKPPIADALLQMWPGKRKTSFDSLGVCWTEADGLVCNGSDSAVETRLCKTKTYGVRDCRIEDAHRAASASRRVLAGRSSPCWRRSNCRRRAPMWGHFSISVRAIRRTAIFC